MANVLYITANVKQTRDSYSLTVGEEFIKRYKEINPDDKITHLDLYQTEIPLLDDQLIGCMFQSIPEEALDSAHQTKWKCMQQNLAQFMEADKYIFAVPFWNYSVPPMVKAYFDNVSVAGKTFKHTENGPVGLLVNKSAVCIQASGGIYSTQPSCVFDFGAMYIKSILSLFGVVLKEIIYIEGVNIASSDVAKIKEEAIRHARQVAESF